uniref:Uncharacterized protein n=1 Tax=Arion vulgaris TaxID=1028688 RepID=A0A0B6YNE1_9EUPU
MRSGYTLDKYYLCVAAPTDFSPVSFRPEICNVQPTDWSCQYYGSCISVPFLIFPCPS